MELDNITEFAWFLMWRDEQYAHTEKVRLMDNFGGILPPGRALLNGLDADLADCSAEPQGWL